MIDKLLNRQFVLECMGFLEKDLRRGEGARRRRTAPLPVANITAEDYERTRAALSEARERGPEGHLQIQDPPADRRDASAQSLDDVAFVSRDAVASLVQSALEQYYEEQRPEFVKRESPGARRGGRRSGPVESPVTDIVLDVEPVDPRLRLLGRFEITDPGWVNTLIAMGLRQFRDKRSFNDRPATPYRIRDDARVVLVADWGSGLPRAKKVSEQIRNVLDEGKAQGRQQHVVHLGDVYYSGWQREYEKRFCPYWPVQVDEDITSWACNGNHEMYSGGYGYFDYLLGKDERFALQEGSSFFSLENQYWQILGLDTAWEAPDFRGEKGALVDPQAQWVKEKLDESPNRKTLLLSHHQLFSAYEGGSPELEAKLGSVLSSGRIDAWFWGHEHRCVLYKANYKEEFSKGVRFGRCIGHGGVPVYANKGRLPEPIEYEYQEPLPGKGWERWARFGFAVLDFDGGRIHVRYLDETGHEHKKEIIK